MVESIITIIKPAWISLLNIPLSLPSSAKISPTSPLGIMAIPIIQRECHDSSIKNAPIILLMMATANSAIENTHI